MKKRVFLLGITIVMVVIGLSMAGCASMTLVSLETDTVEGPSQVRQGQDIDPVSITIWGNYKDNSRKLVTVRASNITFDKNTPGTQTVRVRIGSHEASFQTEVKALLSLTIASPPTKVDYLQGESLDIAGLRVMGEWEGFPQEEVRVIASNVSGFTVNTTGVRRLTVTILGKSATFDVDVWALTGIALDKPPNKTDYAVGDRLDLTGIVVNGNYAGSTASKRRTVTVPVNQLSTSGFNSNAAARQQRVTVTVGGQSANFFVNIEASPIGIWRDHDGYRWTFNAGGTGTTFKPGDSGDAHFKWTASGNRLTVEFFYDGISLGVLPYLYGITGNTLTMQSVNTDGTVRTNVPIITLTRQ